MLFAVSVRSLLIECRFDVGLVKNPFRSNPDWILEDSVGDVVGPIELNSFAVSYHVDDLSYVMFFGSS